MLVFILASALATGPVPLQATAQITFKVVIPESLGFDKTGAVSFNGDQRTPLARSMTYEDTMFAGQDNSRFKYVSLRAAREPTTLIYTISRP